MMVSSKGRYALRVMLYLAQNDREELVPLKEIAESQNISMKYLEMIVSLLHKGDMLISGRGKKGGYRLARKSSEYTIGSILKLTEKNLATYELSRRRQGDLRESRILYYAPNVAEAGWYY